MDLRGALDPVQMKREVEGLIRHLGGPSDPALIERHPHAVKRGTVLVKVPVHNDCLQRAVERAESKADKKHSQHHHPQSSVGQQEISVANFFPDGSLSGPTAGDLLSAGQLNLPAAPGSKHIYNRAHSAPRSGRGDDDNSAFSPSMRRPKEKGGVISFKSKARLYLGSQFPCGAVDSPGPIYEQKGNGINTTNGRSFGKARRDWTDPSCNNSGPSYTGMNSIGKQFLSQRDNPGSVVFPKSMRFGEVKENERTRNRGKGPYQVPGPGAFLSDILHLPHPRGGRVSSTHQAPSFGVRHSHQEFVSPLHSADYLGRCSPGPAYDVHGKERGIFPPSKSASFGKGERVPLEKRDRTPGPAHYGRDGAPDASTTQIQGPAIRFARSGRLRSSANDSPGPIYNLSYGARDPANHSVKIGGGPDEDWEKDRFHAGSKIFLGKGLGVDAVGNASPGPMYNPKHKWDGPQHTLTFKEKKVRPSLFPRPQRARFISDGLSKAENLGSHSPGPGAPYDLPSVGIRSGKNSGVVCYSFGSSKTNRDAGEVGDVSSASPGKSDGGRGEHSGSGLRSTNTGADSGIDGSMHARVPFYNTDISVLSTTKPIHSVVIAGESKRKSPGRGGGGGGGDGSSPGGTTNNNNSYNKSATSGAGDDDVRSDGRLYNPDISVRYPSAPKFSFGKGDRSSTIWKTTDDRNTKLASFGTSININWSQVEQGTHGPRLGGLSKPGL